MIKYILYLNADSIKIIIFAPVKLKLIAIMNQLQVQVFMNETTMSSGRRLFERIIEVNDSFVIPFETIIKSLAFLFGGKVIINFKLNLK